MTSTGQNLPWSSGWHPYFKVVDTSQTVVEFDKCSPNGNPPWNHIIMGEGAPRVGDLIPTGKTEVWKLFDGTAPLGGTSTKPTYYDDEFKSTQSFTECPNLYALITDPLMPDTIKMQADNHHRIFQIFTGSTELWGEQSVVIEPMTGLADAYNNHDNLVILSAGETFAGSFAVSLV
jgi:galactose mutarotase-like enzyme